MATVAQWVEGARPRTLPNAIAPVLVGSGAAAEIGGFVWWQAGLTLVMTIALIIGVNFANDYSDGIRGTDEHRVGPLRLVGSGIVRPVVVRNAAFAALTVAGLTGLLLVTATGRWWLLVAGGMSIVAAWYYTGGKRPYGYAGLGEIAVFVFFGLVAVLGTTYLQAGTVTATALGCAVAVGAFSSAVLVANNLRDIPTDAQTGKRTLAVMLGEARTRRLYRVLVITPFVVSVVLAVARIPLAAGLLALPPAVLSARRVSSGAAGLSLVPVLRDTGIAMLLWAVLTGVALAV
ncbi:1,4-dihydroxy-2-naphthoate polyprenyltransferase [Gandjariella thermophila]|nr:1,4-dihydroxy-2-naphthoate polyprenyltransferase [Gandjariella thermophila]